MATPLIRYGLSHADEYGAAVRRAMPKKVIVAYHGSPHSFDRFDASKIGTGEGAQAYGHGLYFAGAEDTADFYRRKLAEDGDAPERWARDYWAAQAQPDAMGSPEAAFDYLLSHIRSIRNAGPGSSYSPGLKRHYAAAEKYLLAQNPYAVPAPVRQGHMYEVEIGHPEESLLDWDAPMDQQPGVIQKLYDDRLANYAPQPGAGRRVYRDIVTRLGEGFDDDAGGVLAARAASEELLAEGVPGIRYLDQGSRPAGEGTRNYVMFPGTEDHIRILRKYGLLAPMGAGAMGEAPADTEE